ncbi:Methyltransferase type 11 domain protein, partial [mine drainage metagenome]
METYDDVYLQAGFYWGEEPNGLCREVLGLLDRDRLEGLRALDLGCGEGRDLIHLARHGLQVTGVDISQPGLAKAELWAADEGLSIRTVQAGLDDYRCDGSFDLIYSSGTLT